MNDGEYRIDRIEDGQAFLEAENEDIFPVPIEDVPAEATEGSVCQVKNGVIICDEKKTLEMRKKLFELAHRLAKKD